ncbi:hypothetical protein CV727_02685 [Helicobacter pylori]|nr:hypothetical protein CV727_02685 [Helicobacter pylori]
MCMQSITPLEILETALKNAFERFYFLRKMADAPNRFYTTKRNLQISLVKILLVSIRLLLRNIILSLLRSS